jgi:thiol-disulfide isomerase/thioredoxin
MRAVLLIVAGMLPAIFSFAQSNIYDTLPPYKKHPTIPDFNIQQADNSFFTKINLPQGKAVIIIFFNPDCGHCQLVAHSFEQQVQKFKDDFFVWISYGTVHAIDSFAQNYHLNTQPNMRFGRDVNYFIPPFYQIRYTPFIAAYSKEGKLLQVWDGGTEPQEVLKVYGQ